MTSEFPDEKPLVLQESSPKSESGPEAFQPGEKLTAESVIFPTDEKAQPTSDAEPGWLHWSSLAFDIISHSRNYLVPAIIALFSVAKGEQTGVYIAGLFFFPSLGFSLFRYFTLRYRIMDRQFVVSQGLIFRTIRTVPVERIQNVDLVQNVLHRIFGVAEVRIETASGSEPEAVLRVLAMERVERLREEIFGATTTSEGQTGEVAPENSRRPMEAGKGSETHPTETGVNKTGLADESVSHPGDRKPNHAIVETILEVPLSWLVRAGLASNRGMIMVGIAVGLTYNFELLDFKFNLKSLKSLLPDGMSQPMIVLAAVLGLVALWLILRILGIGWYILRFSNYQLKRKGEDLQISCGLLTKVSATVPRQRIQLISIHRNLVMRWMKLASIRIETAGSSSERDDATKSVSRQWFLPVLPQAEVPRVLKALRPSLEWQPDAQEWIPLSSRTFSRQMRLTVLISLILIGVGIFYSRAWGWMPGAMIFFFWTLLNHLDVRFSRYCRFQGGVVYESDWFNRKTTMTFFDRIQVIRVDQSPFDRRWKMAALTVDTAGAGAAEHSISISRMDADVVISEHIKLRKLAAENQPDFS